jgi:hypothetical protein
MTFDERAPRQDLGEEDFVGSAQFVCRIWSAVWGGHRERVVGTLVARSWLCEVAAAVDRPWSHPRPGRAGCRRRPRTSPRLERCLQQPSDPDSRSARASFQAPVNSGAIARSSPSSRARTLARGPSERRLRANATTGWRTARRGQLLSAGALSWPVGGSHAATDIAQGPSSAAAERTRRLPRDQTPSGWAQARSFRCP